MRRSRNTHADYRQITSKRDDVCSSCNGPIKAGTVIGWNGRLRKACCASCWHRWCAEVAEERRLESYGGGCW